MRDICLNCNYNEECDFDIGVVNECISERVSEILYSSFMGNSSEDYFDYVRSMSSEGTEYQMAEPDIGIMSSGAQHDETSYCILNEIKFKNLIDNLGGDFDTDLVINILNFLVEDINSNADPRDIFPDIYGSIEEWKAELVIKDNKYYIKCYALSWEDEEDLRDRYFDY